ncbi:HNH endonuclease [Niallia sp. 03091]|uniref:HNH endonuclease n=1 Tax=Niallia sp. 03091 TaxID=3458059 RepID=UPI004044E432
MEVYRRCNKIGCRERIPFTESYCDKHKQHVNKTYNRNRYRSNFDYVKFYNSKEWKAVRKLAIGRDKGLCQECKRNGYIKPFYAVDHIKRVDDYPELKLDLNNLQCLCFKCHNIKTRKEEQLRKRK